MPKTKINKKYTHFAFSVLTKKIVDGWEYKNIDNASIKEYYKMDMKDNDRDRKLHKLLTGKHLARVGIDPYDSNNWGNS